MLAQEDIADPKLGWKKVLEIEKEKDCGFSGTLHQRSQDGSRIELGRCNWVLENIKL